MRKIIIIWLLMLPISLLAQTTIRGTVTDQNNEPLPGVSVLLKGTQKGTVSDFDGYFTLKVDKLPATLQFTFIGYKTLEKTVKSNKELKIKMKEANEKLKQVVIGYGTSAKKDIAGTVTQIKTKQQVAKQYNNVASLLQGRSTGVQVNSNSGTPGAAVSIRIRGANSLRGNNEPLYVIDGVIVNSAGEDVQDASTDANEMQQTQNGLTGIDPRDIKDIVILKDASATAIYGSRGANGVVLITTKKGRKDKTTLNVYSSTTLSNTSKIIPVLNGVEYAEYRNKAATINGNDIPYLIKKGEVYKLDTNGDPSAKPLRQVNWQKELYHYAMSQNNGFNLSGGLKKSTYYLSYTHKKNKGIVPNTFLTSDNIRLNYDNNITKAIKVSSKINFYNGNGSMAQGGSRSGGSRSFTRQLISYSPLVDGELETDDLAEIGNGNPFEWLEGYEDKSKENRLIGGLKMSYKINSHLRYSLNAGMNYRTKKRSRWYSNKVGKGSFSNGYLALSKLEKTAYTVDNLINYRKTFGKVHKINATAGITYDGSNKNIAVYEIGEFPIDNLRDLKPDLGQVIMTPYTEVNGIQDNVFSYLGRVTYSIKDRYVFNGSFRADKSSKFKNEHKTGYFPSASFAWHVDEEKFLEDSKTFSKLKLRASWGQVGNQAIKPYQTLSNYTVVGYSDDSNSSVLGVAPLNIANDDLTWETTTQTNVGLDWGLFENRITGSFDAYDKKTSDLLIYKPIPSSTGYANMVENQGGIENRGIEASLNALVINKKTFSFSIGGNVSFNKNKITDLSGLAPEDIYIDGKLKHVSYYLGNNVSTGNHFKAPANAFIEGQPVGVFWGYKTNGIYEDQAAANAGPKFSGQTNLAGDVRFVDVNGDGNIDDSDKTVIGDPNPDFVYGFNTSFKYKSLSLDMLFNGKYGNDILNGNLLVEDYATGSGNNIRPEAYFDAWTPNNKDASHPRVGSTTASDVPTDRLIEDGSYLRLSNVTLSYDLNLKEKSYLKSINFFVSANNLLTFTNYSGYDPELTSFLYDGTIIGVDWLSTPNIKSYSLGVNLKF